MPGIMPYPYVPDATSSSGNSSPAAGVSGDIQMTADGVKDTFVIPHTLGKMPGYANVVAKNALAIGDYSVMWDASKITIMYSFAPNAGTLMLTWIAV